MNSVAGPSGGETLLIRPEKIRLSLTEPSETQGRHRFQGTIREVLFQGALSQFLIDSGSTTLTVVCPSSESRGELKEGAKIWASFADGDAIRLSQGKVH
jgi:ABC-type Fe3+/spermidine/putrescine transport system ATPase subunit